jgi:hypothetical protein
MEYAYIHLVHFDELNNSYYTVYGTVLWRVFISVICSSSSDGHIKKLN